MAALPCSWRGRWAQGEWSPPDATPTSWTYSCAEPAGPSCLSGDVQKDAAALRKAAGGGADIGFDMVGGAAEPSSTLAALNSLRRGGRLVLMGSMTVDLPVSYMQLMINSLEIIGNFMYPASAVTRARAGSINRKHAIGR
jgi:threonine dehydrogenase-like Zn-dependent dehydrogenase